MVVVALVVVTISDVLVTEGATIVKSFLLSVVVVMCVAIVFL